jgi:hypothetical protein
MENPKMTRIDIPYPDASELHLHLAMGACRVRVVPGEGDAWVSGTYEDPTGRLPCKIEQDGGTARITQKYDTMEWWKVTEVRPPRFDLAFGKARPYTLTIEIGASENNFDLGGLPIQRLVIKHGAGKADFDFRAPNPQVMDLLDLDAGAVGMEMRNLANANFSKMTVDGGAASYRLDFGGTLQRDAEVRINAGVSAVEIHIPTGTAAKIETETVLGGLDIGDGLMKKQGAFWTEAALAGRTPVLAIHASVALGSLRIRSA